MFLMVARLSRRELQGLAEISRPEIGPACPAGDGGRGTKPGGKNAMRTLAVAAASAIGMGLLSTADVSAMPANATAVRDAASVMPAVVTPARYYVRYRCFSWRYRYHYRYRCYYYR
jgi:hypothetical protein